MSRCFLTYLKSLMLGLAMPAVLAGSAIMLPIPVLGSSNAALASFALPDQLEVKLAGKASKEVTPGTVVTTPLRVANRTRKGLETDSNVELPEGWRLAFPLKGGALNPGEEVTRLVAVHVPARAGAGAHKIRVSFHSQQAAASATATIELLVQPKYDLEMQLGDLPRLTRPGATHASYVQIANRSNAPVTAVLQGTGGKGLAVHLGSAKLRLAPQAVRRIDLEIGVEDNPAENTQTSTTRVVEIAASIQEAPGPSYKTTQAIDVASVASVNLQAWRPLSTMLTMRMAGRNGQAGPQAEIAGGGTLFKERDHEVRYLARIPYRNQPLSASLRETYRLRYQTDGFDLRLGDHAFDISPLSTPLRQGRGGEVAMTLGSWTMGGIYRQGRHYWREDKATAAYLRRDLGAGAEASTYYLGRHGSQSGQLVGVQAELPLPNRTQLDAELSGSVREKTFAGAYRFALAGGTAGFTYDLRLRHADYGFVGNRSYQGKDTRSIRLAYRPMEGVRLEGGWNDRSREYSDALSRSYNTEKRGVGIRMNGRWSGGRGHTFIGYKQESRMVQQGETHSMWASGRLSLQAGLRGKHLGLNATAEMGQATASNLPDGRPFQLYKLRANTSRPGLSLSAGVEYRSGARIYSTVPDDRWSMHLNAQLKLSSQSQLLAGASAHTYGRSRHGSQMTAGRASVHGRFKHEFSSGHLLEVKGRYSAGGLAMLGGRSSYTISHSIPFGIPIKQKTPPAQVQGRVIRGKDGQPLPDVLMHLNGMSVWTDQNGEFAFRGVSGGHHLLMLDPSSLEVGQATRQHMPLEMNVDEQHPAHVDIQVMESGSVKGQVMRYKRPEDAGSVVKGEETEDAAPKVVGAGGLGGMVLQITNGTDERRLLSDGNGQFSTTGLYPGRWTLQVQPSGLPEHHYIEQEVFELEVRSGHQRHVEVKVLPENRAVRIIESGELD